MNKETSVFFLLENYKLLFIAKRKRGKSGAGNYIHTIVWGKHGGPSC